jgi:hypothetical protein
MMEPTQHDQVVDVGAAMVDPRDEVVHVGPRGWGVAAGEATSAISDQQCFADPGWDQAVGAADLEGLAGGRVEDGPPDLGVAGDALRGAVRNVTDPFQPRRRRYS